jgi:predicted nucleic acid-binding protein
VNVVDSSGWLEYAGDGANAGVFEPPIVDVAQLLVPAICLYEVFKKVLRDRGEEPALALAAQMRQGRVVDLDGDLALEAARLGVELNLPLADSVILATARAYDATLWTQDDDFAAIPGVRFTRKQREPA